MKRHMATAAAALLSATAAHTLHAQNAQNDITRITVDSVIEVRPTISGIVEDSASGNESDPVPTFPQGSASVDDSAVIASAVPGLRVFGSGTAPDPAVYVDGVHILPGKGSSALDNIDPTSIKTIEILKGPQAIQAYGVNGVNGVIVITTKKGKISRN